MTSDRVSMKDLYQAIERLETKIDEKVSNNSSRIDKLETFKDRWAGAITLLSIFGGAVAAWFWERIVR